MKEFFKFIIAGVALILLLVALFLLGDGHKEKYKDPMGPSGRKCFELCKAQGKGVAKFELDPTWGSFKCECDK